jgi:hypothetical protein
MSGGGGECDFCSVPVVAWAYPCRDFQMGPSIPGIADHGSSGAWAACPACHGLIERGGRDKLAARSAKRMVRKHGIPFRLALQAVRENQDGFWAHREGPPVPAERFKTDPTPPGRVDPKHQMGPDYVAAERALAEPVKAILAVRTDLDGVAPTTVYYYPASGKGDVVWRADMTQRDGQLVQDGDARSLGGGWDDVRIAVSLGQA